MPVIVVVSMKLNRFGLVVWLFCQEKLPRQLILGVDGLADAQR